MAEQIRSLVTLSSSALVLSVSALHVAPSRMVAYGWVLALAWTLFTVTVAVGAIWHFFYRDIRAHHMRLWTALQELREKMLATQVGPDFATACNDVSEKALDKISRQYGSALLNLNRCNTGMSVSFTCGLVALLAFAIANLP